MTEGTAPSWAGVAETHSAVVYFAGDRAYKLKKPVDLGFLDFTDRAAREAVCHREVALNRRIAPDVYLGVADVVDEHGAVCDHLVVMRRLPDDCRLSRLVLDGDGAEVDRTLRRVATLVAQLHAASWRSTEADAAAGDDALRNRWSESTELLLHHVGSVFAADDVERAHGLAMRYLVGRRPLLDDRIARGRAVDGHGDLIADDIFCMPDGPRILDCIEFDDRYRLGDGLADAAFLAMDLERLGRPDLGERFLAAYADARGDAWPPSLAHHHLAYRAHVRAKVGAIRAAQGDGDAPGRARQLLGIALDHLERGRVRLVVVGGAPGTGKSTLARALAGSLDAVLLRSDEVRKELAGIPALQAAPAGFGRGIYDDASTHRTYQALLDRAEVALGMGESVVLDATWLDPAWRARVNEVARLTAADLVPLRCVAPIDVIERHLAERAERGPDASDATADIARRLLARSSSWTGAVDIDTTGDETATLAAALRAVDEGGAGDTVRLRAGSSA